MSVALAPVVATAILATTSCAVAPGVECTGNAQQVHRSSGTPSDMVAKSTLRCSAAVRMTGYIEIQRRNSAGDWYTYKRTDVSSFTTVPGATHTRQAATRCARGTFRNKTYAPR